MDTLLFLFCLLGGITISILFRVEEKFAGGKFREFPLAVDIIFAGGKFRAKSKFAKIAKLNSTRKIGVIQYLKVEIDRTFLIIDQFHLQTCHLVRIVRIQYGFWPFLR